jgi:hypothetical protein
VTQMVSDTGTLVTQMVIDKNMSVTQMVSDTGTLVARVVIDTKG